MVIIWLSYCNCIHVSEVYYEIVLTMTWPFLNHCIVRQTLQPFPDHTFFLYDFKVFSSMSVVPYNMVNTELSAYLAHYRLP